MAKVQTPNAYNLIGPDGKITQQWYFFFQQFQQSLAPTGSGYVVDGSLGTSSLPMTMFWGLDSDKGTPATDGYIYFATDTGKIYISNGATWVLESPEYDGDVYKAAGDTNIYLNNVNLAPGTWGDGFNVPVITVNDKGLITNVTLEPVSAGAVPAAGSSGQVQYNNGGSLGAVSDFLYDQTDGILYTPNIILNGTVQINSNSLDSFLYSDGVGAVKSTSSVGNGQVLIGSTGTVPVAATLNYDSGINITNGPGSITIQNTNPGDSIIFNFGDATPKNLFLIAANKIVESVTIIITTPFNDLTSTLSVGDASDHNSLLATTDNIAWQNGTYVTSPGTKYNTATMLLLSIVPGASTQGSGLVTITYQK